MPKNKQSQYRDALVIYLEDSNRLRVQSQFTDALDSNDKDSLYRAFVEDTIAVCLGLENCDLIASYASDSVKKIVGEAINSLKHTLKGAPLARLKEEGVELWAHPDDTVSHNFETTFEKCFEAGHERVVLIDCVTPTISKRMLGSAFKSLNSRDIVFGPTLEGSYYLLGMRTIVPEVFSQIDWSLNDGIYKRVVEVAREHELNWEELEIWYDLRQPGDLEFLARDINAFRIVGDEVSAKQTESALESLLERFSDEEV